MSFGLILKQARTHKKLTQSRLSELLSVSPQTISGWERNVYFPEQDKLLRLAKILDLSLGILTENSPEKDREEHNIVHKDAKEHHTMHKDTKVIAICGLSRDKAEEKIKRYNQLVSDVDHFDSKMLSEINLETFSNHYRSDLKEINLWSYWQGGRSHLDADILLVGQDFSGLEGDNPILDYQKDRFDYLKDIAGYSTTDNNLCELFAELGFPDLRNNRNTYRQLFFTNFVPWYRKNMERNSGGFNPKWIAPSLPFFKRLVEIIEPKIILCLGQEIFIAVLKAGGKSHKRGGYNKVIESGAVEIEIGSVKSAVYPLAHPGSLGTSNRKRGTSEKDGLSLQKADWRKIAEKLADVGRPLGPFRWMPRVIRPTDV